MRLGSLALFLKARKNFKQRKDLVRFVFSEDYFIKRVEDKLKGQV